MELWSIVWKNGSSALAVKTQRAAGLIRRSLNRLAGALDARTDIINGIVHGTSRLFHGTSRPTAADCYDKSDQGKDGFHKIR